MTKSVREFYESAVLLEWKRLLTPLSKLEFQSTLHLIEKYFPKKGHICDIGCGPGRYAIELLKQGYNVTLFDLSEASLEFAKTQISQMGLQATHIIHSDARNMSTLETNAYDAVLLMGPLYHLPEEDDRKYVLAELRRILKPQGIALIAYLNVWGFTKTSLTDYLKAYKDMSFVRSMLEPINIGIWYLSTPTLALEEVRTSGFEVVSYAGVEGFAGGMKSTLEKIAMEQPETYTNIVQFAVETCELQQYRDTTDHLHIICRNGMA
jgi:S-adenosylmethionine-dependent methyltransferase